MKIPAYIFTFGAVLAVGLTSCEKELDFEYHDIEPLTVIEGSINQDGSSVRITHTTPMDEPMNRTPLTDATVTLSDVTAGQSVELLPDEKGNFVNLTPGIVGHTYTLTVENGSARYEATSTMLPPVELSGLEFQWIKMPYDYVAVLQVSFSDNPSVNGECYWVRIYRNGEIYMWSAINDHLAVDGRIDEVVMTSRKDIEEEDEDQVLREGDVVSVKVSPISQEMHDYLEAISNGTSNGPQMYSGDFCLGYFLAAPVAESSIVFHPDEMTEFK